MTAKTMKNLYLLGYAPAEKNAWPHGGLTEKLEALDLRHGVAPNLVMTPILSTACHLAPESQSAFLAYVRTHILEGDQNRRHRRYNVLSKNVGNEVSQLDDHVRNLFEWRGNNQAEISERMRFDPERNICLVFSYWAITALLSFLIQKQTRWTRKELKTFGVTFVSKIWEAVEQNQPAGVALPPRQPENDIPRLGVYFRICTQGSDEQMRGVLRAAVRQLRDASWDDDNEGSELEWVISVLRSLVPLPHNEVYQGYKEDTNPIGKYQACFMCCEDPKQLKEEPSTNLMWRYVGEAIAKKLG